MSEQRSRRKTKSQAEPSEAAAEQIGIIREYLKALERLPRHRQSHDAIRKDLLRVEERIHRARPVERLTLVQRRRNLQTELRERSAHEADVRSLEARFVTVAREYSERTGISYGTWREVGVPAPALQRSGIPRGTSWLIDATLALPPSEKRCPACKRDLARFKHVANPKCPLGPPWERT